MPKLSQFKHKPFMRRTRANRMRRKNAVGRKYLKLFRQPKAGGQSLVVPLKCGYQYTVQGTGAASIPIDQEVGLQYMINPGWYNRYAPIFNWVKINKCRVEVTCPVNIGQTGVSNSSLYRMWSKKASAISETPPTDNNEWLNMQNAKRSVFSSKTNSVNYYFTPAFEAPQGATIAKRLMYKRWFEVPSGPTGAIPHLGIIAHIVRMDGGTLANTERFNVNVTLYCQFKGITQL